MPEQQFQFLPTYEILSSVCMANIFKMTISRGFL